MTRNTKYFIAKTDQMDQTKWLPLSFHLKDTAGVMQALTDSWLPDAMVQAAGLTKNAFEQIALFIALTHDLGKATPAFQLKVINAFVELKTAMAQAGLTIPDSMMNAELAPHAKLGAELLRRAGCPESVAVVIGAHHGRPESMNDPPMANLRQHGSFYWGEDNRVAWRDAQEELIDEALSCAGYRAAEELPELTAQAQMLLTGLVIMADWIASNTAFFPLIPADSMPDEYDEGRPERAMARIRLPGPWNVGESWTAPDFFHARFGFEANQVQRAILQTASAVTEPGMMILEAPMGCGKTEAALGAAEILLNRFHLGGVGFFLPSQATSNAMFTRLLDWVKTQPDALHLSVQLAHAMAAMNDEFAALEQGRVCIQEDAQNENTLTVNSFFRGRKTTLLADLVIGTVDQLLMAGLKQKHVMLRHLGLAGKVVIVDECHAYDAYMNQYLDRVLSWLGAYRVPVILLSATLPGLRRETLLAAYFGKRKLNDPRIAQSEAYPLLTWTEGDLTHMLTIPDEMQHRTVELERITDDMLTDGLTAVMEAGGCAGVIVNTVRRVQAFAALLKARFPQAQILIDHSQFLAPDRLAHEQAILDKVGKRSLPKDRAGVIVIGSQVLEQSLDLDFDLLATDLCPMDLLLQRIGRLHRRPRPRPEALERARCLVMNTDPEALEDGARAIYGDYLLLRTCQLLPDAIRIPDDISALVQKTYDEGRWTPKPDAAYGKAKAAYTLLCEKKRGNAKAYCIGSLSRKDVYETLPGLLSDMPGFTEPQARAAVRDGDMSVEVLVLAKDASGQAVLLSGEKKGQRVAMDCEPDLAAAREIARQRLRLPGRFARPWCIKTTIDSLQEAATRLVPEWEHAPLLQGELFLLLNENCEAELCGVPVMYDAQIGLVCKEEKDGTDRV